MNSQHKANQIHGKFLIPSLLQRIEILELNTFIERYLHNSAHYNLKT
jgi:hypothetical protein